MKVGDKVKISQMYDDFNGETAIVTAMFKEDGCAEIQPDLGGNPLIRLLVDLQVIKPKSSHSNEARKARDETYRSAGMKRVRGNLGGTFYE